ncbi:hypothetical protein Sjap_009638 [Stephania japonica]|uniref:Uncharacterized protein n=1 Tax=Stephania japonica TaxID=461633 RepID=A0AAP0JA58_9MAGN
MEFWKLRNSNRAGNRWPTRYGAMASALGEPEKGIRKGIHIALTLVQRNGQ